jgi:hypothetical protein
MKLARMDPGNEDPIGYSRPPRGVRSKPGTGGNQAVRQCAFGRVDKDRQGWSGARGLRAARRGEGALTGSLKGMTSARIEHRSPQCNELRDD